MTNPSKRGIALAVVGIGGLPGSFIFGGLALSQQNTG
jgi:hypothetical protein